MNRKLTIMVSDEVYQGLHRCVGRWRIGQFIDKLARPHVVQRDIEAAYPKWGSVLICFSFALLAFTFQDLRCSAGETLFPVHGAILEPE
jgi:hypothetical protein